MRRYTFLLLFLAASIAAPMLAQTIVTEADLVASVGKVPEEQIVNAISAATVIDIDTSFNGVLVLSGKGVTPAMIAAINERKAKLALISSATSATTPLQADETDTSRCPASGVHILSNSGWKEMRNVMPSDVSQPGYFGTMKSFVKRKTPTVGYSIDGAEALVKAGNEPRFCIDSSLSQQGVSVLRLEKGDDARKVVLASTNMFGAMNKVKHNDKSMIGLDIRTVPNGIVVGLIRALEPGEYVLSIGNRIYFDFSVPQQ